MASFNFLSFTQQAQKLHFDEHVELALALQKTSGTENKRSCISAYCSQEMRACFAEYENDAVDLSAGGQVFA